MRILLAVDGSAYTKRMLSYVAAHDELLGSRNEYTALTVVAAIPQHAQRYVDLQAVSGYYDDEAKEVLEPVTRFAAQLGWKLEAKHLVGNAGDLIAETAINGRYGLIVMGSHGHSALGNVVLGSVASRVLARCKIPVLIIR